MKELGVIEQLFDDKILRILNTFFEDEDFYLREIAKKANVPAASTYRIINKLVDMNVIELIMIKKFKLYKLKKSKQAETLKSIFKKDKKIIDLFVEKMRELSGLKQVILHGKETKDKANILLIGEDLDTTYIKSLTYEIKEQYNFTISSLNLTEEQYDQMSKMGLYSGEKKTLFLRR